MNSENVKKSNKKSRASYRKLNSEKVRESYKESTAAYRKLNHETVRESNKKSTETYRKLNSEKQNIDSIIQKIKSEKVKISCDNARAIYRQSKPKAD